MPKIPYNKRKDGRYYKQIVIGVDDNGRRKVKTLYDRDWRMLDEKVREFMVLFNQGQYIEKNITLGECIELWWNSQVQLSEASKRVYKSNLKHLNHLLNFQMKDLKPMHLQLLYNDLYNANARNLANKLPCLVKNILEFAVVNNFLNYNIANKVQVSHLKIEKKRALTIEEKEAVNKR